MAIDLMQLFHDLVMTSDGSFTGATKNGDLDCRIYQTKSPILDYIQTVASRFLNIYHDEKINARCQNG